MAPIALYPDPLVAQILAASTDPMEVVEAARWLDQNQNLKGEQLTQAAASQGWDNSIQALVPIPQVLQNMNKNLSWTSALGDAYAHQPQSVMNAIQVLRGRAQAAGTLKTTQQQTVTVQAPQPSTTTVQSPGQTTIVPAPSQTIVIEPSNPQVIYVPSYNPTAVYGAPVAPYPGYSSADLMLTGMVSFGMGMMVGSLISGGGGWGCNWHGGTVVYNHNTYVAPHNIYAPHGSNYWHNQNSYNNWDHNHSAYNNWQHNQQVSHRQQGISNYEQHETNRNREQAYNNLEQHHDNNPASGGWSHNRDSSSNNSGYRGYQKSGQHDESNAFGGRGTPGEVGSWSQRGRQSFGGHGRFR